jgi:hypothetical protein
MARAKCTVTGPTGTWEIFVSKFLMPQWQGTFAQAGPPQPFGENSYGESERVNDQIQIHDEMRTSFSIQAGRYLIKAIKGFLASRKSPGRQIEAINWSPPVERLRWTTTDLAVERVVEEIVTGLKQGKVVQPEGAVFSGAQDDYSGSDV